MNLPDNIIKFLNEKVETYNRTSFIELDPISVPHRFKKKQDIEIAAFFASIFAWGNRKIIINKTNELMQLMGNAPHDFCKNCSDKDLKDLLYFKHRTFSATDLLYFVSVLNRHYLAYDSLETAFSRGIKPEDSNVENALIEFYNYFFSVDDFPQRTTKHIASPAKKSACKRLNMYLRWMVRKDNNGVDFGIWKTIKPSQLVIPLDLHVARVSRQFKLIDTKKNDWTTAVELTNTMKLLDKNDPCKYDFALFSLGVYEKQGLN